MPLHLDDTIAAIASPPGRSVRGIVRVSGPQALILSHALFSTLPDRRIDRALGSAEPDGAPKFCGGSQSNQSGHGENPVVRSAGGSTRTPHRTEGLVHLSDWGVNVPASLMVWPTTRSFTGQTMVEFHVPGSPAVLNGLLEHLWKLQARPAERGEFTMRAFLNGRIDLLQAEAVLGVIDAASHEELRLALTQLGGGMTHRLQHLREALISILGDLEAGLDFVEEDIEFITREELLNRLSDIHVELDRLSSQAESRLVADWHPRIVLAGLPNAGKSTLFNLLTESRTAIVSAMPGTTRDYLTAEIQINGVRMTLVDTAGWEEAQDAIMGTAQNHRDRQLHGADLVLWCHSAVAVPDEQTASLNLLNIVRQQTQNLIHVVTQIDRLPTGIPDPGRFSAADGSLGPEDTIAISAQTGAGCEEFRSVISRWLESASSTRGELLSATSARCKDSLRKASDSVESAMNAVHGGLGDELISLDLRNALHELGMVMGAVYTDDILDHIFSHFCIGK